ncbi:2-succinyl-5-enolpyruvyl-6-hydroxy-3-cyclohexene-1-carboxylic-acid synthase [Ornithinimicrobium sp. W1665]|uniref:2-succinyl-5-enolpyruvyl-6-hydroxy-3- cyclohexene-1-carboxylic-acid synthase n=1 Tax=Ornithinimicrobium sp. W1665 TaxID=3416666 RepID=UPI003D6A65BF
MHPSTALATVLVDELVRGGVREAVLCPGSRSAPLAYALEEADRAGRLRLHVRVDERSAAFLALGMARASARAVPVVTTSGTAVANLHPAVLEAHHGGVPLVVLSADRPAELRGTGANQTTVQPGMFGGALRHEVDLPAPERRAGQVAHWRSSVCRALAAALDPGAVAGWSRRGPVHLNVGLRDPLAPALEDDGWPEPLDGRPHGGPWVRVAPPGEQVGPGGRTLVLVGDLPDPELTRAALDWAGRAGWPVLAEPFGVLATGGHVVRHPPVVAARAAADPGLRPDRVVWVGRLTLFRELAALLRLPGVVVEQVSAVPAWTDPSHVVQVVHGPEVLRTPPERAPGAEAWVRDWVGLGEALTGGVRAAVLADPDRPSGPAVAATVAASLGDADVLVLGSSNGPRDLATGLGLLEQRGAPRVVSGRGLAGIDGTVSAAVGVALAVRGAGGGRDRDHAPRPASWRGTAGPVGRTVALMGDLTFLHDVNGLLVGTGEPRPDLTVVVVNDDGGGIFSTLEYGDPARSATPGAGAATERLFGTPHGTDLSALCAAHHVEHHRAATVEDLAELLRRPAEGIRVLEVPVDRSGHRRLHDLLRPTRPPEAGPTA